MLSQCASVIRITTVDKQVIRAFLEDLDRAAVHRTSRRGVLLPLVHIASMTVRVHLLAVSVRDYSGA